MVFMFNAQQLRGGCLLAATHANAEIQAGLHGQLKLPHSISYISAGHTLSVTDWSCRLPQRAHAHEASSACACMRIKSKWLIATA